MSNFSVDVRALDDTFFFACNWRLEFVSIQFININGQLCVRVSTQPLKNLQLWFYGDNFVCIWKKKKNIRRGEILPRGGSSFSDTEIYSDFGRFGIETRYMIVCNKFCRHSFFFTFCLHVSLDMNKNLILFKTKMTCEFLGEKKL